MFSTVKENRSFILRVLITQFGAVFLALTLSMATAKSDLLLVLSSVAATVFYLSLLYTAFWDLGAKQEIRIEGGRAPREPLAGLGLSIVANLPSVILAILIVIGSFFAEETVVAENVVQQNWASEMQSICTLIARIWHAMYWGFFYLLDYNCYLYILFVLPALAASALGYYAGMKNFKLLVFLHLSNGEVKKKSPFDNRF